jgi:hypothetical protein
LDLREKSSEHYRGPIFGAEAVQAGTGVNPLRLATPEATRSPVSALQTFDEATISLPFLTFLLTCGTHIRKYSQKYEGKRKTQLQEGF